MAGSHTRCNDGKAPTDNNNSPVPIPAVSCAPTAAPAQTLVPAEAPTSAQAPASTPAPASVPGPPGRYTDEDLQRATKLVLESFIKGQEHGQLQASSVSCE